jgi:hypothetical protein
MRFFSLVLPAAVALGWGAAFVAQEAAAGGSVPSAEMQAALPVTPPGAIVPPEVQEKAKTYKGAAVPPRALKKLSDGHWTPYDPPEKPEGAEWYTIQTGDTLSRLAQQKLGTWLLWPQIWDANPYIKDAHWIYPGDPLLMTRPQVVSEAIPLESEPAPVTENPSEEGQEAAVVIEEEAPQPPINAHDVYCSGYITKTFRRPHLTILSSQRAETAGWVKGDVVYLNEGKAEGIEPGQSFRILRPGQKVSHPVTGREIGQYVQRTGAAKILAVQEHSCMAEITDSCDEIYVGNVLVPWVAIPIPWDVTRSATLPLQLEDQTGKVRGRVIWSEDRLEGTGENSIIYVDLGSRDQLIPGDKLWVFRYPAAQGSMIDTTHDLFRQQKIDVGVKDLFRYPKPVAYKDDAKDIQSNEAQVDRAESAPEGKSSGKKGSDPSMGEGVKSIPMYIGEGVILTTEANTACVKVIKSSSNEIAFGDWVVVQ